MNVAQLRELLKELPDNARVVTGAPDHSYREARCEAGTALYDRRSGWSEDYGEEQTPEAEFGKRLPVLIVH